MKDVNCGCDSGQMYVYYKNESRHSIRCDCYECPICKPESSGGVVVKTGEEEISVNDFTALIAQGWENWDI